MSLRDKIKPISEKHSIKEAVISLFLSYPILKPARFESLIKEDYASTFQKFEAINQINFQIHKGAEILTNSLRQAEIGFKFSSFENGRPFRVLQGLNEPGRTFISYHNLAYKRWNPFFDDYKAFIGSLGKIQSDIFINAFSLHYIDELLWVDKSSPIDLSLIFKRNNSKLPPDFFDSLNPVINRTAEKVVQANVKYFDRLEIRVSSHIQPSIFISHNVTEALKQEIQLKDLFATDFESRINEMHKYNKELLNDMLTDEVIQLIELT